MVVPDGFDAAALSRSPVSERNIFAIASVARSAPFPNVLFTAATCTLVASVVSGSPLPLCSMLAGVTHHELYVPPSQRRCLPPLSRSGIAARPQLACTP